MASTLRCSTKGLEYKWGKFRLNTKVNIQMTMYEGFFFSPKFDIKISQAKDGWKTSLK